LVCIRKEPRLFRGSFLWAPVLCQIRAILPKPTCFAAIVSGFRHFRKTGCGVKDTTRLASPANVSGTLKGSGMAKRRLSFRKDEDGAVTIDWIILTAGIVGLIIAIVPLVEAPVGTVTGRTQVALNAADATTTFE
jgi:Flp pilus assembly pilin Flp